ncbi:predicted protein [Naegleria gruberi]|uniref:Predicted protein n=1 Tax=Naegleria gruberi TaxID=5762 RepID=D2W390_NAEGR|nr:uncharacterized protein NAEGRDRAFT_75861 [Naegleria gruberi]EFC36472.1 predicted protein [Naegleria gruberi]|eukprot:XP_002669216.1 predicted protein [Naegleria gruberi strain NEG-M]
MSQRDVQHLLSLYIDHHLERLQKNDPLLINLFKLFKNSKICDDDDFNHSESVLVDSEWIIGQLERLVEEYGSCEFCSNEGFPQSWLWKVLCMNEKVDYNNERVIRDEERERKDSDLAKMGEWLLKNYKANANEIYTRDSWEAYHILYVCAKSGSLDKVRVLLKYGADVNHFSKLRYYHEKPISIAFRNEFLNVAKELCGGGYHELFEINWYELMDGFEYNCMEVVDREKSIEAYLDFFSVEYVKSENQIIPEVIQALDNFVNEYQDEQGNIIEEFNGKCNNLRKNSLMEKLKNQRNRLTDLVIICEEY